MAHEQMVPLIEPQWMGVHGNQASRLLVERWSRSWA